MQNKEKKKITIKKSLKQSLNIVNECSRFYIPLNIIVTILRGIIPAVLIILMQNMLNMLQKGEAEYFSIIQCLGLYIFVNVISAVIGECYGYYNNCFSRVFSQYISLKMLRKASELGMKDFENPETYNVINRAQNQNGISVLTYIADFVEIIRQIISIISITVILVRFKWWIVLAVFIVPGIQCVLEICIDKRWYQIKIGRTKKERKNWYINFLLMTGSAFKEIKLCGISEYFIGKYKRNSDEMIEQDRKIYLILKRITVLFDMFEWGVMGGIYIVIFHYGFRGIILIGDVTAYIESIGNLKDSIQGIYAGVEGIVEQSLYINLLFDYLELPVLEKRRKEKLANINKIELKNVSFRYANGAYALKDINMIIRKNNPIALIGENGSGKTTLIKLILGFYSEYEGEILVNDINLENLSIYEYQQRIGCVFQDYNKYETSIKENIELGDIKNINSKEKLWSTIRSVGLEERVEDMGNLETVIGKWFGEQELSIGEWQRIAIARTLFKEADMYVFDEPDASLDIMCQQELFHIYRTAMRNRIGLYVSHKIDNVQQIATQIYVLQSGKILEYGSHEELIKKSGKYKIMWEQCRLKK